VIGGGFVTWGSCNLPALLAILIVALPTSVLMYLMGRSSEAATLNAKAEPDPEPAHHQDWMGWNSWGEPTPPSCTQIEIMRNHWNQPITVNSSKLSPMMNINGLHWRYPKSEEVNLQRTTPPATPTDISMLAAKEAEENGGWNS